MPEAAPEIAVRNSERPRTSRTAELSKTVTGQWAGSISSDKSEQHLSIMYHDTGFLPAEVTLQATGVELEKAAKAEKE
jgi:hypothetical protein